MKKEKITTLFLDIGGVLLSNGWGHDFRQFAVEEFCLNRTETEDRHNAMVDTYEEGRITLDEYLKYVVFFKKRDFSHVEFREFMFSLTTPHLEMIAFMKKIKLQYGLKIVAVSNEARELNAHRIKTFELNKLIDFYISSCYVHLRKPDSNIYLMALDTASVSPEQVIYIDDVQLFVDIASEIGIKSIRHTDWQTTSKSLKKMGLHSE